MADTVTDEETSGVNHAENHTDNHMDVENCKTEVKEEKATDVKTENCSDPSGEAAKCSNNDKQCSANVSGNSESPTVPDGKGDAKGAAASPSAHEPDDGSESEDKTEERTDGKDVEMGETQERKSKKSLKRRIRMRRVCDLDSDDDTEEEKDDAGDDDDDDDDDNNNDDDGKTSDTHSGTHSDSPADVESESEEEKEEDLKPLPRTWNPWSYLRGRELGMGRNILSYNWKARGSVGFVERLHRQHTLDYHQGCVNTLHFNQCGNLLATGSDDLEIVLWDWARNKPNLVYHSGHKSNVFQAKFMPYSGDTTIVSCARDGQVRVGHLSSTGVCKGTKKIAQHRGAAHKLALEPDSGVNFLSCGEDSLVFSLDLREDKPTKLVSTKEGDKKVALYTIFSNPMNTHEFAVGGRDHFVRVYDRRKIAEEVNDGLLKKFCPHHLADSDIRANVTCLVYNYNGQEILASYNDEDIYLFDSTHSDGAEYIHRYQGHRNNATVKGVNFYGPQSEFVVSGSDCGHVYLWEKQSERIVQFMEGDEGGVVNCLEPHPTYSVLATSGLDHDVKIWAPTAEEPTKLEDLNQTKRTNRKERDEERRREPDMIDGHMLWYIMHHLRRRARRQARDRGERDSDSSSSESDDSDDSNDSGELPEPVQCAQS
ncbi:DDB1- and CUL4-associated factor 8-like [Ptychodera flava]|uniref:DDB1- and CUL4-associated factor 8-like n=1 Tax=Ptychodera flava TaxID=63121 RepID=UPI00396A45C9